MSKTIAVHGVSNVKYALRTGDNKYETDIKGANYALSVGLTTRLNTQEVYGDNKLLLTIPSDQGYEGQVGMTGPDEDFEIAAKMQMKLDDGSLATVKQVGFVRMAVYYEVMIETDDGQEAIKCWTLNVEFRKPNVNHQTNTQQVTIGDCVYPLTVYGEDVMSSADEKYRDSKGVGRTALRIISRFGDTNYENFEKSVPIPLMTAV